MPELHFNRASDVLTVAFGAYQTTLSWADIMPNEHTGQQIYDDAAAYGRQLFDKVFHNPGMQFVLSDDAALEISKTLYRRRQFKPPQGEYRFSGKENVRITEQVGTDVYPCPCSGRDILDKA